MKSDFVINEIMSPDERFVIFMDELIDLKNKKNYGDIWENFDNLKFFLRYSFNLNGTPSNLKEECNSILNKSIITESVSNLSEYKEIISEFLNESKLWNKFKDWAKETGRSTVSGIKDFIKTSSSGISSLVDKISNSEWIEVVELLKKGTVYVLKKLRDAVYSPVGMILETILILTGIGKVPQMVLWGLIVGLDIYEILSGDYEGSIFTKLLDLTFDVFAFVATGTAAKAMKSIFKGVDSAEGLQRLLKTNPKAKAFFEKIPQFFSGLKVKLQRVAASLSNKFPKGAQFLRSISNRVDEITKRINNFYKSNKTSTELAAMGAAVVPSVITFDVENLFENTNINEASLLSRFVRSLGKRLFGKIEGNLLKSIATKHNLGGNVYIKKLFNPNLTSEKASNAIKGLLNDPNVGQEAKKDIIDLIFSDKIMWNKITPDDFKKLIKKSGYDKKTRKSFESKFKDLKGGSSRKTSKKKSRKSSKKLPSAIKIGFQRRSTFGMLRNLLFGGKNRVGTIEFIKWSFSPFSDVYNYGIKKGINITLAFAIKNWLYSSIFLTLIKSLDVWFEKENMTENERAEYFNKDGSEILKDILLFFKENWVNAGFEIIFPFVELYKIGKGLLLSMLDIISTKSFKPDEISTIVSENFNLKEESEQIIEEQLKIREEIINSFNEKVQKYIEDNPDNLYFVDKMDTWNIKLLDKLYTLIYEDNRWYIIGPDDNYYSPKNVKIN